MNEANKNFFQGVDIYDYTDENYMTVMSFDKWRVAYLNYGDDFEEKTFHQVERHMESDEVFVLLEGEATLIIGEELRRIEMKPHKVYNIRKGIWHHIVTKEGTRVLIIENEDTGEENSEYLSIK